MSLDERSPKRQRLNSYSPAPSPERKASLVEQCQHHLSFPQTPPPSVHMSPSWTAQSLTTSASHEQHQVANGGSSFPTPPNTAGFLSQNGMMDRNMENEHGGASQNITGSFQSDEGDVHMHELGAEEKGFAQHRRTDHERDFGVVTPKLYRLASESASSQPSQGSNLMQLYGLEKIQASVARKDAAGNKINKLRKSYEGKAKTLGLEGRIKAAKTESPVEILGGLLDPGWDQVGGDGKTWWEGRWADLPLNDPQGLEALIQKTESAFALQPGRLPKREHDSWASMLGLDDTVAGRATPASQQTPARNPAVTKAAPTIAARSPGPASPGDANAVLRPERAGRKRRYDESSYTGYQEGYDDDGYSTGGGSVGGPKRQKRLPLPVS
nr:mediator of rna polymerase ii transcription subunit 19 [Quercus suber]